MFNIPRLSTLLAALPLALSASLIATDAKARHFDHCTTHNGIQMCTNLGYNYDEVAIAAGNQYEILKVRCTSTSNIFRSYGDLTQAQAQTFVDIYCQTRRGY